MNTAVSRLLAISAILPALLSGESHPVVASVYYRTFSAAHPPLLRVRPGDAISTKTLDSGGQDREGARRAEPGNPLTGPFYVEGAEPGDGLVVHIDRLRMNRGWGYTLYRLLLSALAPESIEGIYSDHYKPDLV